MNKAYPYHITLKIKAFDILQLFKICKYIKKISERLTSSAPNSIFLPLKKKHFSLCRSPHVHKKSRTQLVYKRYKAVLYFQTANFKSYSLLLFFFKTSVLPGVEFELCVREKAYIV